MTFLAEAGEVLASSLDYNDTLAQVAQLSVPGLADWCTIDMVGANGRDRAARGGTRGSREGALGLRAAGALPADPDAPDGVPQVIRSAASRSSSRRSPAELLDEAIGDDLELRRIIDELGLNVDSICVPLIGPRADARRADADRGGDHPPYTAGGLRAGDRARPPRRGRGRQRTALPRGGARCRCGAGARLRRPTAWRCSTPTAVVRHWNPAAASRSPVSPKRHAARTARGEVVAPPWDEAHVARAAGPPGRGAARTSDRPDASVAASAGSRSPASTSARAPSTRSGRHRASTRSRDAQRLRRHRVARAAHAAGARSTAPIRTLRRDDVELSEERRAASSSR